MQEAKIFMNGQSQAVRLPKDFRFDEDSVYINKVGDSVILFPKKSGWNSLFEACGKFSDDFMSERDQGVQEKRESFK